MLNPLDIDKSRIKGKVWYDKNLLSEADFSDDEFYKPYFNIFYILRVGVNLKSGTRKKKKKKDKKLSPLMS